jgi:hypothetical protein
MTTVRVTRMESRVPPGPVPDASPTYVIVLAHPSNHVGIVAAGFRLVRVTARRQTR